MTEEAREARRQYYRKYCAEHKEQRRESQRKYWEKKSTQAALERAKSGDSDQKKEGDTD